MLSVELLFIRRSLSCIFPEGMDLLIPLFDSEWHLADTLLQQPDKMVNAEDVFKFMEDRTKKQRKPKPKATSSASPLSSPSGWGEKRKEIECGSRPTKESQRQRKEAQSVEGAEAVFIRFPPNPSIHSDPKAFI